ncbi:MAG: orotidine 5'-phosphate decarboxylase / HUMPS family protein [Candidatus Jacksonbacteria bacterium]
MKQKIPSKLNPKKRYLQIALNSTLAQAAKIINHLPISDRILLEAGTPLIKRYGEAGIRQIKLLYSQHLLAKGISPYIVADLKMMDRGAVEVEIAARGGADAAVALGHAPIESLDALIAHCENCGIDAMIDMMNVEFPLSILRKLKKQPAVVILHRGVDETEHNKQKMLPWYEIRRIKGSYDIMIAVAGGDTIKEIQSSIFNDADIVVVWKSFYQDSKDTVLLAEQFLATIK